MNRLKELRQKNNLTLKELGKKVGMLDSTLSQYENGKRNPNDKVWQKLADFFKVSVPYIKGEIDINKIQKILQTMLLINCGDEALNSFNQGEFKGCNKEDKKRLAISYLSLLICQELNIDPYDQFLAVVKKYSKLIRLKPEEKDDFINQNMRCANSRNEKHDINAANKLLTFYDNL
jgi:transcriptional regulator with XRE-family HTH domain